MNIKRGDIFLANLEPIRGKEQGGIRPVLIIQNNMGNNTSPVTIISAITSKSYEKDFSTNVSINKEDSGLDKDSTILLNQLRTIDKSRLIKHMGGLDNFLMNQVDMALKISLGLN